MLSLLDLATGENQAANLYGRFVNYEQAILWNLMMYFQRGRRLREYDFKAFNLETDGIAEITEFVTGSGSLKIKQRFTKEIVEVTRQALPDYDNVEDLYIAYNDSEASISVANKKDWELKDIKSISS